MPIQLREVGIRKVSMLDMVMHKMSLWLIRGCVRMSISLFENAQYQSVRVARSQLTQHLTPTLQVRCDLLEHGDSGEHGFECGRVLASQEHIRRSGGTFTRVVHLEWQLCIQRSFDSSGARCSFPDTSPLLPRFLTGYACLHAWKRIYFSRYASMSL